MNETKRFLGLELAGAKNQKTSLAVLEFYPKEKKVFLLDIFDHITQSEDQTGDEAVLEAIREEKSKSVLLGVNVALDLPPCITCTKKQCPTPTHCTVPAVKWMRETTRRAAQDEDLSVRVQEFTPYTQRPIELWTRYHVLPGLKNLQTSDDSFQVDETLGGNRAPLVARMNYLSRHLQDMEMVEVWPKLTLSLIAASIGISNRTLNSYRKLEDGALAREEILIALTKAQQIFIYERDLNKLSQNLTAFDAFICAYTAMLSDQGSCVPSPKGFPHLSGWVQYPQGL